MIICYNFALSSLILRTKLGEGPFYVRFWNGPSSSLVPFHIGFTRELHRKYLGIL